MNFLLGGRNSGFEHLNLLQSSKRLPVNIEYHLKSKLTYTKSTYEVKKGAGAMTTAKN